MNIGAGQTGSTCWFFSSLNIFLTSDNGLKILWQKLQEVYPTLKPREKNYFNSNINAPCPYKGGVKKTSAIYFWKFLNQYICAIGGPGRLIPKSGLNAYLTKNIKWRGAGTRESKGASGAHPSWELPAILGHLGFRVGRDFRMLDAERWRYKFKNNSWTAPVLMYSGGGHTYKMRDLLLEKKGYDLTGAIVYVAPAFESNREPHVWACAIRNGKGYITDSNYPTTQIECKWWLKADLERHFMTVNQPYRTGVARLMGFDVIMYTRKEFTNKIAPSCQLPKSYKPLTAENENLVNQGNIVANYFRKGNVGNLYKKYPPRIRAEIIRRNASKPVVTPAMYAKLANEAGSYNHGMRMLQSLRNAQGVKYKINRNGPNFLNYSKKLIAKFPQPIPKNMWNFFWQNASSNKNFVNTVRKWAVKAGYAVNENQLNRIIATRAKTRAGTKRAEERIYRAGNNWYNNKGNNVTTKINPANWVLNETPNTSIELAVANLKNYSGNVKTYRRK
jgi:hypothetical protein